MEEKAKNLNVVLKQLRLMGKLSAVFIIICFMVYFRNISVGIGMFVVLAVYFIFFYRRKVRLYQKEIKDTILAEGLRPALGEITYKLKDPDARAEVLASGFLPAAEPEHIVVRETVRASWHGAPLLLTDVSTNYRSTAANKKGKTVPVMDYLSGCYLELRLPAPAAHDFMLWPADMLPEAIRAEHFSGWQQVTAPAGEPALPEGYLVYVPQGQPAPELYDRLRRDFAHLVEFTPGRAAMQVQGDRVRFFIKGRFVYTIKLSIFQPMSAAILTTNPFPEIDHELRVAETVTRMQ